MGHTSNGARSGPNRLASEVARAISKIVRHRQCRDVPERGVTGITIFCVEQHFGERQKILMRVFLQRCTLGGATLCQSTTRFYRPYNEWMTLVTKRKLQVGIQAANLEFE